MPRQSPTNAALSSTAIRASVSFPSIEWMAITSVLSSALMHSANAVARRSGLRDKSPGPVTVMILAAP